MVRHRLVRLAPVMLVATIILWLTPGAHAALFFVFSLTPNSGPIGTHVTIAAAQAGPAPTLDTNCILTSSAPGLLSSTTCTVTQSAAGFTVSGSFIVASGAALGAYSVDVEVTSGGGTTTYASGENSFTVTPGIIPEYPLGLSLLAVLTVIGYGIIRRRTRV